MDPRETAPHEFSLTEKDVLRRKAYLQLTPQDEEQIRRVHPLLQKHAEEIINRFYDYLLSHDHTRKFLDEPEILERLKGIQRKYFERLTSGIYDLEYFKDRIKAGRAHDRVGLTPEWYLGAYQRYLSIVSDVLSREMGGGSPEYVRALNSLTKVIFLDMGLAMDAYIHAGKERLGKRTRELEELDAKKKLLSDMIVHDLRNPVAGIQGFLTILKSRADSLTEAERKALGEAERACASLNEIVDNVLDVSRMEEGKLELSPEELDLNRLVQEAIQVVQPLAQVREREVRTVSPDGEVRVHTDARILHRILLNLMMNSLRHASTATFMEIRIFRTDSGRPAIEVVDDGRGIAPAYHPLLFEKFGGNTLRKAGIKADTGLGLVFCGMAAKELGANLELDSDIGKGTRVRLTFAT